MVGYGYYEVALGYKEKQENICSTGALLSLRV